jgi:hypothetical protein
VKRYRIGGYDWDEYLEEDGRWVEYEDVQQEIYRLKLALHKVQYEAKSLADAQVIALEAKEPEQ